MMKLGRDTGSLVNYVQGNYAKNAEPEVGMGATMLGWSDRHACTIVEIFEHRKRKMIAVTHDTAKRTDKNGFSESQTYEFTSNMNGTKHYYRLSKEGKWEGVRRAQEWETGQWIRTGDRIALGYRDEYYDFSF